MENILSKLIEKLARAEAFEDVMSHAGAAVEIVHRSMQSSAFAKNARVCELSFIIGLMMDYRRLVGVIGGRAAR